MGSLADAVAAQDTAAAPPAPVSSAPAVISPAAPARAAVSKLGELVKNFGPWTSQREDSWGAMPMNYLKGVLGVGPALTSTATHAVSEIPTVVMAAAGDKGSMVKIATEAFDMVGTVAGQVAYGVQHPLETIKKYPFELTPVVGGATKLGAGVALKAAETSAGAAVADAATSSKLPGVAAMSRGLGEATKQVAAEGPYRPAGRAVMGAIEKNIPAVGHAMDQYRAWKAMQDIEKGAQDETFLEQSRGFKQFHADYGALDEAEHQEFVTVMANGHYAEASPPVKAAVEAWNRLPGQVQNEWINLGKLRPDVARRSAFQPARIEAFGKEYPAEAQRLAEEGDRAAGMSSQDVADFVKRTTEAGGSRGPIPAERLPAVARYLRGLAVDPAAIDPMDLAREIFEKEAPRAAKRGQFPQALVGDFEGAVKAGKVGGSYDPRQNAAPLMRQIEGVVRGAVGTSREVPAGLLGGDIAPGATPVGLEVRRGLQSARTARKADALVRAALLPEDAPGMADADFEAIANARTAAEMADAPIPHDVRARAVARDPMLSRTIGGVFEKRLQTLRSKQTEARQPMLSQMTPAPRDRRIWQMTREEFDNLPEKERNRRFKGPYGAAALRDPDPYAHVVERAIRARKPVPREVLEQNPDWQHMALSSASRRIAAVTEHLAETLAAKGANEPIYFPFIRDPALFPRGIASGFSLGKRYSPRTLRQRSGTLYTTDEFAKNPAALAVHNVGELLKYKEAEAIVNGIINDPKIGARRISSPDELREGEVAWSPDGLKLWRSEIDFGKKFLAMVDQHGTSGEEIQMSLAKAIAGAVDEDAFKATAYGFKKPTIYAIPQSVANHLNGTMARAPTWVKIMYDTPTAIWRYSVLALRPAWVANNIVGNVIFSALHGVAPRHYIMALQEKYVAKTPDNLNGIQLTSQEADVGKLLQGDPRDKWGQFLQWLDQKPSQVGISDLFHGPREMAKAIGTALDPRQPLNPFSLVRGAGRMVTDFNQRVEGYWRRANYFKAAEKLARAEYVKRAGEGFAKSFDLLDELDRGGPKMVDEAIRQTNLFMHDYQALLPWERAYLRRGLPFVNFMKLQARLLMSLPMDYPGRFTAMQTLVLVGNDLEAYDNSKLPQGLHDKGLFFTGFRFTVHDVAGRPHVVAAWGTSTGWNPFVVGYNPGSTAVPAGEGSVVSGAAGLAYAQANPLIKYGLGRLRAGYDIQSGRPLTKPGVIEMDGKFYDSKTHEVVAPPTVDNPLEQIYGNTPQIQLVRHLKNPMADYTAEPFSTATGPPKGLTGSDLYPTRTAVTELLRYFTPVSIILVDETEGKVVRTSLTKIRARLYKSGRENYLRHSDEKSGTGSAVHP